MFLRSGVWRQSLYFQILNFNCLNLQGWRWENFLHFVLLGWKFCGPLQSLLGGAKKSTSIKASFSAMSCTLKFRILSYSNYWYIKSTKRTIMEIIGNLRNWTRSEFSWVFEEIYCMWVCVCVCMCVWTSLKKFSGLVHNAAWPLHCFTTFRNKHYASVDQSWHFNKLILWELLFFLSPKNHAAKFVFMIRSYYAVSQAFVHYKEQ